MYIEGNDRTSGPIWNYAVLHRIVLFNSTAGNCAATQVAQQSEHGGAYIG